MVPAHSSDFVFPEQPEGCPLTKCHGGFLSRSFHFLQLHPVPNHNIAKVRSQARSILNKEGFVPADELRALLREFMEASSTLPGAEDPGAQVAALPLRPTPQAWEQHLSQRLEEVEQSLLRQETELTYCQQIARLGSWSYDLSTNEIWWSQEMCRLFGFADGETELAFSQFFERIHPEDRDKWLHAVENASQSGKQYEVKFRARLPDGSEREMQGKGLADFGEDGGVWRIFGTVQELGEAADSPQASAPASQVPAGKGGPVRSVSSSTARVRPPRSAPESARSTAAPATNRTEIPPAPNLRSEAPPEGGAFGNIHSSIGMWDLDMHTGDLAWSGTVPGILDLPDGTAPSLDRLLTLFTPQSRQDFEGALQRTVLSGEGFFMQVNLNPQLGAEPDAPRLFLVSARLQGSKGTPEFKLQGTIQNVTGWAQA